MSNSVVTLSKAQARRIWLRAQKLDSHAPFGNGPQATPAAVRHLGYVQIDTINVIERCHHHILYTRIPEYRREHLHQAQTVDKSVFEYWGHALAYLPTADFRFHVRDMRNYTFHARLSIRVAPNCRPIGNLSMNGVQGDQEVWVHQPNPNLSGQERSHHEWPSPYCRWRASHRRVDGVEDLQRIDIRNAANGDRIAEILNLALRIRERRP